MTSLYSLAALLKIFEPHCKLVVDCQTEIIHVAARHYSSKLLQAKRRTTLADAVNEVSRETHKFS